MGVALTYSQPVKEGNMKYCIDCDTEFADAIKHLDKYHGKKVELESGKLTIYFKHIISP